MIRLVALVAALALAGAASVALYGETRYRLRAAEPIHRTLADSSEVPSGLVIVFQPEDCFGSGEMVGRWNGLHAAGRFPVTGLVVGDGSMSDEQRRIFREQGVQLPVRGISARDAALIAEKLGYASTPFAVVLDAAGRVTASFPASQNVPVEVIHDLVHRGL